MITNTYNLPSSSDILRIVRTSLEEQLAKLISTGMTKEQALREIARTLSRRWMP